MKTLQYKPILCLELLKTFSSKEMENLSYLVNCRYFNTDKYVVDLLNVLKRYKLEEVVPSDEFQCIIYEQIFSHLEKPKGKLTKNQGSQLNRKMNDLLRLAEKFLVIKSLEENTVVNDELLYPQLIERRQSLLFNRHINKVKKTLDNQETRGVDYYEHRHKLENNIINYHDSMNQALNLKNVANLERYLDMYYLLYKLTIHLGVLSFQLLSKEEYDFSSMKAVNVLLELSKYSQHPLIAIYQANIDLEKDRTDKAYFYMLDLLDKHTNEVESNRLRSFYTNATNYCILQRIAGNQTYNQHLFNLYKIMHNKDLLIDNGVVPIQILKNIVTMSCRAEEYDWATEIIRHYETFIPKSIRRSVCEFCYGVIAFHQKNYEAAHERFIQVDKINTVYDINARVLIIKCLYEKEKTYNEYTMTAFRSIEKFFKTNKELPVKNKKAYKNFIQILINLYRVRHHEGKRTLEWLKEKLEQQEVISDKRWLLEKIEELEKNRG